MCHFSGKDSNWVVTVGQKLSVLCASYGTIHIFDKFSKGEILPPGSFIRECIDTSSYKNARYMVEMMLPESINSTLSVFNLFCWAITQTMALCQQSNGNCLHRNKTRPHSSRSTHHLSNLIVFT